MEPLDKAGNSTFSLQLEKLPETSKPLEALIRVSLADEGGRPETGTLTLPVVGSNTHFLGIKPLFNHRIVGDSETEAKFEVIAIDEQGERINVTDLEYELFEETLHYSWYQSDAYAPWQYRTMLDDKFLQKGTLSAEDKIASILNLPIKDWGQYRLEIKDPHTSAKTSLRFRKGWFAENQSFDTPDKVIVKIDKEKVKPGESIELYIESPFDGQGLLTIANDKVLELRNFELKSKGTRIKLKAEESWGVGVYCLISAIRPLSDSHKAPYLPKRAIGITWVGTDSEERTLDVNFTLPKEIKPRQMLEIPIQVIPKKGKLNSSVQLTFAAVDEGILKITDFQTPKPQDYFLGQRVLGVERRDLYGRLIDPLPGAVGVLREGGDANFLSKNIQALSKHSFKIISIYSGLINLDKEGKSTVSLNIPDFNGTLRLMGVAFDEKRFGSQGSALLVRDPIVIEGVLPRFLGPEDKSRLSLSLHNIAGNEGNYQIEVSTEGELLLPENKTTYEVFLEKLGKHTLQIPIQAKNIGSGKIRVVLKGEGQDLVQEYELSIRPYNPYRISTEHYFLKPHEVASPSFKTLDAIPGTEEVTLTFSTQVPWDTQRLFKQLSQYPYGCVEQIASKGMGSLFDYQNHKAQVNQAIALLSEKQSTGGGFSPWIPNSPNDDLFLTSYVLDFYLRALAAGFEVPTFSLEKGLQWLKTSIQNKSQYNPLELSGAAYAFYVLTKADQIRDWISAILL